MVWGEWLCRFFIFRVLFVLLRCIKGIGQRPTQRPQEHQRTPRPVAQATGRSTCKALTRKRQCSRHRTRASHALPAATEDASLQMCMRVPVKRTCCAHCPATLGTLGTLLGMRTRAHLQRLPVQVARQVVRVGKVQLVRCQVHKLLPEVEGVDAARVVQQTLAVAPRREEAPPRVGRHGPARGRAQLRPECAHVLGRVHRERLAACGRQGDGQGAQRQRQHPPACRQAVMVMGASKHCQARMRGPCRAGRGVPVPAMRGTCSPLRLPSRAPPGRRPRAFLHSPGSLTLTSCAEARMGTSMCGALSGPTRIEGEICARVHPWAWEGRGGSAEALTHAYAHGCTGRARPCRPARPPTRPSTHPLTLAPLNTHLACHGQQDLLHKPGRRQPLERARKLLRGRGRQRPRGSTRATRWGRRWLPSR